VSAEKFLDVARLVADEADAALGSVTASLAVLAGVAASDAACCSALGQRSRGGDHHDAEVLLAEIVPGGQNAATALRRLIERKDKAQYGMVHPSGHDVKVTMRQAERLIEFAKAVLAR
jgi:HEPN domain-containing protein